MSVKIRSLIARPMIYSIKLGRSQKQFGYCRSLKNWRFVSLAFCSLSVSLKKNKWEGTLKKLAGRYKGNRKHTAPPDRVLLTCGCGWQKAVDVRFWEWSLLNHVLKFHEGRTVTMPSFTGESNNGAPIIGAGYWKKGKQISGAVTGIFPTQVGTCYNLSLMDEIEVDGENLSPVQKGKVKGTEWSIGALKGLDMAIRASGCGGLQVRDLIILTCTGTEKTKKGNDRVNFKLQVTRK